MMTMTTQTREEGEAAIWAPVVGLQTGETVQLPGGLTHDKAMKAADIEADRLAEQGKAVEWYGARRIP